MYVLLCVGAFVRTLSHAFLLPFPFPSILSSLSLFPFSSLSHSPIRRRTMDTTPRGTGSTVCAISYLSLSLSLSLSLPFSLSLSLSLSLALSVHIYKHTIHIMAHRPYRTKRVRGEPKQKNA